MADPILPPQPSPRYVWSPAWRKFGAGEDGKTGVSDQHGCRSDEGDLTGIERRRRGADGKLGSTWCVTWVAVARRPECKPVVKRSCMAIDDEPPEGVLTGLLLLAGGVAVTFSAGEVGLLLVAAGVGIVLGYGSLLRRLGWDTRPPLPVRVVRTPCRWLLLVVVVVLGVIWYGTLLLLPPFLGYHIGGWIGCFVGLALGVLFVWGWGRFAPDDVAARSACKRCA